MQKSSLFFLRDSSKQVKLSLEQFKWENVWHYETLSILHTKLWICTSLFPEGKRYYNTNCSLNYKRIIHWKWWDIQVRLVKLFKTLIYWSYFFLFFFFFCNIIFIHSFIYQLFEITELWRQIFHLNPETPNYAWKVIGELLTEGKTILRMRQRDFTLINIKRKFTSCSSVELYASILF